MFTCSSLHKMCAALQHAVEKLLLVALLKGFKVKAKERKGCSSFHHCNELGVDSDRSRHTNKEIPDVCVHVQLIKFVICNKEVSFFSFSKVVYICTPILTFCSLLAEIFKPSKIQVYDWFPIFWVCRQLRLYVFICKTVHNSLKWPADQKVPPLHCNFYIVFEVLITISL